MSRPSAAQWADAIGAILDDRGRPTPPSVAEHLRQMVVEHGLLTRSRLISALTESYAPFDIEPVVLRGAVDEALGALVGLGELDRFSTAGGRAYGSTPPRVVRWGGEDGLLLGAAGPARAAPETVARRGAWRSLADETGVPVRDLLDELGEPAWREDLVALGGADAPDAGPEALLARLLALAEDGEPYEREGPDRLRVLGGSGDYCGRAESQHPEGRWTELPAEGAYLGRRKVGFSWCDVVVAIRDGQVRLFDSPGRDAWRWAVIAVTAAKGDRLWSKTEDGLQLLTPPPAQVERAADVCGERVGAWRWRMDPSGLAAVASVYAWRC